MLKNKNYLDIYSHVVGNERRREIYHEVLDRGAFMPKTVTFEDIDNAFKEWAKTIVLISDEGVEFPTMSLYSSQRFSEYSQTWEYVDNNNNLLLNFKTVSRDNNPSKGEINGNIYNIPGERLYTMKKNIVLDDNGTESFAVLKMKLPTPVNIVYKLSVFTNKYDKLNDFNTKINKMFSARQCYISPNGHYMAMVMNEIEDKTEYNIDDRQFYGQTVNIKVLGYLLTEEDFVVEERPLKSGAKLIMPDMSSKRKASVEIEEIEDNPCFDDGDGKEYYHQEEVLTVKFPKCIRIAEFTIDTDFTVTGFECDNVIKKPVFIINGETIENFGKGFEIKEGDVIRIKSKARLSREESKITIYGYNPNVTLDADDDNKESVLDENTIEEIIVENND